MSASTWMHFDSSALILGGVLLGGAAMFFLCLRMERRSRQRAEDIKGKGGSRPPGPEDRQSGD